MSDFIKITSKDNDMIKSVVQLQKSSKRRRDEGVFVLEGLRLCLDAVRNGFAPEKVILSASASSKYSKELVELTGCADTFEVPDSLYAKISDTVNPQGILSICKTPSFDENCVDPKGRYIAVENLQDPSNLGAISRTAEAFGIDGIFVQDGCDPYSPKSLRASMGALLRIPVYQVDDMFDTFSKIGLKTYASVVSGKSEKVGDITFSEGCVVIVGNEANGISADTAEKSDVKITIPMNGKAESLNAAVAASVMMWEMCK